MNILAKIFNRHGETSHVEQAVPIPQNVAAIETREAPQPSANLPAIDRPYAPEELSQPRTKTAEEWEREYPPTRKSRREDPEDPTTWNWDEVLRRKESGRLTDGQRRFFGFPVEAKAEPPRPKPQPKAVDPLASLVLEFEPADSIKFYISSFARMPGIRELIASAQTQAAPLISKWQVLNDEDYKCTAHYYERVLLPQKREADAKAVKEGRAQSTELESNDEWLDKRGRHRLLIKDEMRNVAKAANEILAPLAEKIQAGFRTLALQKLEQEKSESDELGIQFEPTALLRRLAWAALKFAEHVREYHFCNGGVNPRSAFLGILDKNGPFTTKK